MIRKPTTVVCPHCDKIRVVHLLDPTALRFDAYGDGMRVLECSACFTSSETWMRLLLAPLKSHNPSTPPN